MFEDAKNHNRTVYGSELVRINNNAVFTNLFMAAANPKIMQNLKPEMRKDLCLMLAVYTEINFEIIMHTHDYVTPKLREKMVELKLNI